MDNIIELNGVEKVYKGGVENKVLFGIDLAFQAGSFNSIVGQSGSGKSTLLNIMGTLDTPSSGSVIIDGQNTVDLSKDKLAELRNMVIGFVFQFHFLLPEFTAMENVLMPHLIGNARPSSEILKRADELFEIAGVAGIKDNLATRMSGGQQQRTAIIRALLNNPRLILADEPSGNLDTDNTESVYKLFREVNKEYGTTFVIVTHDRRIAEQTDRIVEIRDGKIVMDINTTG